MSAGQLSDEASNSIFISQLNKMHIHVVLNKVTWIFDMVTR